MPDISTKRYFSRTMLAILISPIATGISSAILIVIASFFDFLTGTNLSGNTNLLTLLYVFVLGSLFSGILVYPAIAIYGIPIHVLFHHLGWKSWWIYLIAGFFGGLFFMPAIMFLTSDKILIDLDSMIPMSYFGAVTGWMVWAIGVREWKKDRPKPDPENNLAST